MSKILNTPPREMIESLAKTLAKDDNLSAPEWSQYCKTGVHKERPPERDDWWHVRAASILRTVALRGPIGVEKLRTKYGGRKNNGMAPEHQYKGSGNIVRTILQQLEKAKLVKQGDVSGHKGRMVTKKGKDLLNNA